MPTTIHEQPLQKFLYMAEKVDGEPFNLQSHYAPGYDVLVAGDDPSGLDWPKPVQEPRIPIWAAGMWPNKAPFRRAARWDGVMPIHKQFPEKIISPADTRDIVRYIMEHRQVKTPFDVAIPGTTAGMGEQQAADYVADYATAGATWWLEEVAPIHFDFEPGPGPWPMGKMRDHIAAGPPRS